MGSILSRRLLAAGAACLAAGLYRAHADTLPQVGVGSGAGGGCSQANAYLNRTTGLDAAHQIAATTFICGLVSHNLFSTFDVLYTFATKDTSDAQLNLVSSSFSATLNGSPTFTADTGYTGVDASTTIFINTGFNPTTATSPKFTLNSGTIGAWILSDSQASASGGLPIAQYDGTHVAQLLVWFSDGVSYCYLNQAASTTASATIAHSTGDWVCTRTASNAVALYRNGSSVGSSTDASTGESNNNIYVLARDNTGSADAGSGRQHAMAWIASGWTSQNASDFQTLGCNYLTTLHGSC